MPRPTKYSDEMRESLCKWIRAGNSFKDACALEGIHYDTFNEWRKAHPEFSDALEKAEMQCKAARIARILLAADKSWQAAAWFLERKYHQEFGRKDKLDQTVNMRKDGAAELSAALLGTPEAAPPGEEAPETPEGPAL